MVLCEVKSLQVVKNCIGFVLGVLHQVMRLTSLSSHKILAKARNSVSTTSKATMANSTNKKIIFKTGSNSSLFIPNASSVGKSE